MSFIRSKISSTCLAILTAGVLTGCSKTVSDNSTTATEKGNDAHWLLENTIALNTSENVSKAVLLSTSASGKTLEFKLTKTPLPVELKNNYPHLTRLSAYTLPKGLNTKQLLKGHNQLKLTRGNGVSELSAVQLYGVLDDLYTSGQNDANEVMDFGATVTDNGVQFKLWAPTASSVEVLLFDNNKQALTPAKIVMTESSDTGSWVASGSKDLNFAFYQYQIKVYHPQSQQFETLITTDPYSVSLSTNSVYSQVVDLNHSSTQPDGWAEHEVPVVTAPEDLILYETHIRDFSSADSKLSDPAYRGKYKAFSETNSYGMQHLLSLRGAGLNTVHLLPTYDLSTINEDPTNAIDIQDPLSKACGLFPELRYCDGQTDQQQTIQTLLASFDPRTGDAQEVMEVIRGADNYNWGYDPYHYNVPEGSYAMNPDGVSRLVEFREMVMSLHNKGFRVIMDVVYNHTFASGLAEKSVLDKIVPGYYHRLNVDTGAIETSTCCDNSATEHAMMEKLMSDSLVVWARDHKIDGFRFDLMGHQPKDAMLRAREAVQAVDPDTYFYGEGWNFGEVANNAQFVQASQTELAGTEIGTFTDRLRDAVRGGNFMSHAEGLRKDMGVGNGLLVVPNELQDEDLNKSEYLLSMDQIRIGLSGNLQNYTITDANGERKLGREIDYGGNPAGYALDPADTVNYVSKHDNQTLWDNHQYRIDFDVSVEDRVRMQNMSLAYPMLSQGIPFIHMGSELLRSKSFLRDSYDYGDWFNFVDFSKQTNNYDVGLPAAVKDQDNWPVIKKILAGNGQNDDVSPKHIEFAADVFKDFIKIRQSSPLFRLRTEKDVIENVSFLNTGKEHQAGLLVMRLTDNKTKPLDQNYTDIIVIFNHNQQTNEFSLQGASEYKLHPVQASGADNRIKQTEIRPNGFVVPGLSTVVLVR